jgi:hypothetical protein
LLPSGRGQTTIGDVVSSARAKKATVTAECEASALVTKAYPPPALEIVNRYTSLAVVTRVQGPEPSCEANQTGFASGRHVVKSTTTSPLPPVAAGVTVTCTVVLRLGKPAALPVMVSGTVPVAATLVAPIVNVAVAPAALEGLNVASIPADIPAAVRLIGPVKLPVRVSATTAVAAEP